MRIDEATIPPAEPTPEGFPVGRATPTPAATAEAAWKYITLTFGIENRSDALRLVGIAGNEPSATNLTGAFLTSRDGSARYRAFRSYSSFGLRTATSKTLTNYPVLLRLPPGFRATAESFGSLSMFAPQRSSLTFRVPAGLTDYGSLTIPTLTNLGPKSADDEVAKRIRPMIGAFQPLDLAGLQPGEQPVAMFPSATPPVQPLSVGAVVTVPGKLSVALTSADVSNPADYQARNRGWKQVTLVLSYRNEDAQQAHTFDVAAWLFGDNGVVYTGDVPAIGDFGRATVPPEPSTILIWDGRPAGADQVKPGQQQEPRRIVFLVPRDLKAGILVLGGEIEAQYRIEALGQPTDP
jgi:hypothetical protein